VKTRENKPDFVRGVVHTINRNGVWIETEHHTIEPLMGASYPFYCGNCSRTITGHQNFARQAQERHFCPYCGPEHILQELKRGDKVRLHYRFQPDGSSGQWFGERWEW
jgi:hypothetical protein